MHVSQHQPSTGPDPDEGGGRRRSLYVPVKRGPAGSVVRLWRTPFGTRTAVAFTTDRRLRSVLGPTQPWIRLSEAALMRMVEPLGAHRLTIDPVLTARPPAVWAEPAAAAAAVAGPATPEVAPVEVAPAGIAPVEVGPVEVAPPGRPAADQPADAACDRPAQAPHRPTPTTPAP